MSLLYLEGWPVPAPEGVQTRVLDQVKNSVSAGLQAFVLLCCNHHRGLNGDMGDLGYQEEEPGGRKAEGTARVQTICPGGECKFLFSQQGAASAEDRQLTIWWAGGT